MIGTVVEVQHDRLVLTLPDNTQEFRQGDVVDLTPRARRGRRRFAEGQLLREHAEILSELPDDRAWLDAAPVGRERL